MKLSVDKFVENLIWILTVFILVAYLVFETYTWGRYAYLGASVVILLLSAFLHRGRIRIRAVPYYGFMLLFICFTAASSLWALNMADSIDKAITLALILLCNMMLYVHYQYEDNVEKLLRAVMWAGYIVAIYAIAFYGLDTIMLATAGQQVGNEFSNIINIGMAVAFACTIQLLEWYYKRQRWSVIFMLPCIIVIAATQSRTALITLGLGVFLAFFVKNRESKNGVTRLCKMLFLITAALCIVSILYTLPIFDGARIRMNQMVASFLGRAGADNSTTVRRSMVSLGWKWFLKYPIGGVGIGSPHVLAGKYLARDTYLHNNFVELLCGGGVIGFCVYYSTYMYLFANLIKYKIVDVRNFEVCVVLLIMMLVSDFGGVSYYYKPQWFYLMIHFLNIAAMKRKDKEIRYAYAKNPEGRNQIP